MKFILVLLFVAIVAVFADQRDEVTVPETCQCVSTSGNGTQTVSACSFDSSNKPYCYAPTSGKRSDGDGDGDEDDEWRHHHEEEQQNDEWKQHHEEEHHEEQNLIKNGGFEWGFNHWKQLDIGGFWGIQDKTIFFSELDLPLPPQGKNAAMVASPTGGDFVVLYQEVDISNLKNCANIKFEFSFRYFYRSYDSGFNPEHFFSVDIRNPETPLLSLHNSYVTKGYFGSSTDNKWLERHDTFFYSNAINAFPIDTLAITFLEVSTPAHRLRVGVDDVRLTASCHN